MRKKKIKLAKCPRCKERNGVEYYDSEAEEFICRKCYYSKAGGCYQFVYCNECLAFPLGLGCPSANVDKKWENMLKDDQESIDKFFDKYGEAFDKLGEDD